MMLYLLFLIFSSLSYIHGHYRDPRIATFTIGPETSDTVTVVNGNSGRCIFSYKTSIPPNITPDPNLKNTVSIEELTNKWKGQCISNRRDFWEYQVCFGESVSQSHSPDKFSLGRTPTIQGQQQIYSGGDYCDPIKAGRTAKLTFFCTQSALSPQLLHVRETSTCVYDVEISTKEVCSDPSFKAANDNPQAADLDTEDWYLEISQLTNGHVMCQVYSLEYRSGGSKLYFSKFDLKAENSAVDPDPQLRSQYAARHHGRRSFDSSELSVETGHISGTSQFDGSLAFARIYA